MQVHVINKSTVLKDTQIQQWIPAFNVYVNHVRAWWPRPCSLVWTPLSLEPKLAWKVVFADTSDEAGALGYHDFAAGSQPISFVFAKDDLDNGYEPTVTATHEIAEMIADPWISQALQVSNTEFYAQEIGDPVEADELGYSIKVDPYPAVLVSDFVLPKWFIPGSIGKFDRQGHCSQPLQLLPGGYMSVFVSGHGWKQIYADRVTGEVREAPSDAKGKGGYGRLERYGRDRGSVRHAHLAAIDDSPAGNIARLTPKDWEQSFQNSQDPAA